VAEANLSRTAVDSIRLNLSKATGPKGSVNLSAAGTVVTYLDEYTGINCTGVGSTSCSWSANWLIGSGDLVDPGEQVEITVSLTNLTPVLGKGKEFTIQVKPSIGAVVIVNRRMPAELKGIMDIK
jgi:archaellin